MNEEYSTSSFKSINSILKHSAKNGRDNVVKNQLVAWLCNIRGVIPTKILFQIM